MLTLEQENLSDSELGTPKDNNEEVNVIESLAITLQMENVKIMLRLYFRKFYILSLT